MNPRADPPADRPPLGPHAGVDHGDVHSLGREEGICSPEGNGPFRYVLWSDAVGDVGDLRFWANTPDDALHYGGETVRQAEIGGEGDDGQGSTSAGYYTKPEARLPQSPGLRESTGSVALESQFLLDDDHRRPSRSYLARHDQ